METAGARTGTGAGTKSPHRIHSLMHNGGTIEDRSHLPQHPAARELAAAYELHFTRIFRYCIYRTGRAADAEDITAETFTRLITYGLARVKGPALLAWLLRVAGNLCTDHLRRATARGPLELASVDRARPQFAADSTPALTDARVDHALAQLKRIEQQVVFLRAVEDMSFDEVAAAIGRRTGAVKMLYYRALKRMRASLEKDGELDD